MIHEIDGTIRSVQGVNPGPSSGISYTIVYIENGSAVVLSGQVPVMRLWPEEIDIDGRACVGKKVHGLMTDEGRIWWFFVERPDLSPCPGQSQTLRSPVPTTVPFFQPVQPPLGSTAPPDSTPAVGGES